MVHTAVPSCHGEFLVNYLIHRAGTTNDQRSHIALDLICISAYRKRPGDLTVALLALFFLKSLVTDM
jgi:hypothetical protein